MTQRTDRLVYFRRNSNEGRLALETGRLEREGTVWRALPVRLVGEDLAFDLLSAEDLRQRTPSPLLKWFLILRGYSLSATAGPAALAILLGLVLGFDIRWVSAASAFVGSLFLQLAINVWNDVEDHFRLIDLPGQNGGSGALQNGWTSAAALRRIGLGFFVAAGVLGLPALGPWVGTPSFAWILGAAAIGGLGTLAYSARKGGLKYHALGDLAVFGMCGPILTAAVAFSAFGKVTAEILWIGVPVGLAANVLLHTNNLQDMPIDKSRGVRTLSILLGFGRSKWVPAALYLLIGLTVFLGVQWKWLPLALGMASLVSVPSMIRVARLCAKPSGPESPLLNQIRMRAAQTHLLLSAAMSIGLGIALYLR